MNSVMEGTVIIYSPSCCSNRYDFSKAQTIFCMFKERMLDSKTFFSISLCVCVCVCVCVRV